MAKRRRSRRGAGGPDPLRVVEGSGDATLEELLELIHRVNPTERGLDRREEQRRYGLKSRLQSLLVGRFGDELEVVGERDGVVALRYRYGLRDGCHAIVDELDVDARAMVRRRLDEQELERREGDRGGESDAAAMLVTEPVEAEATKDLDGASSDELVSWARADVEAYDYEAARSKLTRAVRRSGGATGAPELLELYVDHLAADDEAVALADRLPRQAVEDAHARFLLGLAAARSGQGERAARLVRGLDHPRVVEVHLALAGRALVGRDAEGAEAALAQARRVDPTMAEIVRLEQRLGELRASLTAPLVQELEQRYAAGEHEEAERLAGEILARTPDNARAREIVRMLEQRRDAERGREQIGRADEAERRGDLGLAAAHLRRAASLVSAAHGAIPGDLAARAADLERRARERSAAQAVAETIEKLAAGVEGGDGGQGTEGGLASYLALDAALRARVRKEVGLATSAVEGSLDGRSRLERLEWLERLERLERLEWLEWLEELGAPSSGSRARTAIQAVMALQQATRAATDDPGAVARLLAPHARVLSGVGHAARLLDDAARRLASARAEAERARLQGARAALDRGDPDRAAELYEQVDRSALPVEERDELERLGESIRRNVRVRRLEQRLESLEQGGELLAARDAARELAALDDRWQGRLAEISARVRRVWQVAVVDVGGETFVHPWLRDVRCVDECPRLSLSPDGERVHLAASHGDHVFVWELGARGGAARRVATLRSPEPLGAVGAVTVDEHTMVIGGMAGWLLELSLPEYEVLRWVDLAFAAREDESLVDIIAVPDGTNRWAWLLTERDARLGAAVADCHRRRVQCRYEDVSLVQPVPSPSGMLVAASSFHGETRLFRPNGSSERRYPLPPGVGGKLAPEHRGDGLSMLAYAFPEDDEACPLALIRTAPGPHQPHPIEDSDDELVNRLAASRCADLLFVLYRTTTREHVLLAVRPVEGGFERVFTVAVGLEVSLVQDRAASLVVALLPSRQGITAVPLDAAEPEDLGQDLPDMLFLGDPRCGPSWPLSPDRSDELARTIVSLGPTRLPSWLSTEQGRRDGAGLVELREALFSAALLTRGGGHDALWDQAKRFEKWLFERHGDDPAVIPGRAYRLYEGRCWRELAGMVELIDGASTPYRRHLCHVIGTAMFNEGDLKGALATWRQGTAWEGTCDLQHLLDLGLADSDVPPERERREEDAAERTTNDPGVEIGRHARALREADEHLRHGRPREALAVLRQPAVMHHCEVQSLARLVAAYLAVGPSGPVERAHMRYVLAVFADLHATDTLKYDLGPPDCAWGADRLTELASQASAWLDSGPGAT